MKLRALLRFAGLAVVASLPAFAATTLPGTAPLEATDDPGAAMVAGIDRCMDREIAALPGRRAARFQREKDT